MHCKLAILALLAAVRPSTAAAAADPRFRADLESVLGARLSAGARLVFPDSPAWPALTARWDPYAQPGLRASVEAATAADVQATVRARRGA